MFGPVDPELLVVKSFYFFFYSAFGSLFPLMGVYFKQMGMNATQSGFLIGSRPFVEFLAAPFWGSLADRWQKGKVLLLASIACWIIFTVPLGSIQPPAISCMTTQNHSPVLTVPEVSQRLVNKRSVPDTVLHERYFWHEKQTFRSILSRFCGGATLIQRPKKFRCVQWAENTPINTKTCSRQ